MRKRAPLIAASIFTVLAVLAALIFRDPVSPLSLCVAPTEIHKHYKFARATNRGRGKGVGVTNPK